MSTLLTRLQRDAQYRIPGKWLWSATLFVVFATALYIFGEHIVHALRWIALGVVVVVFAVFFAAVIATERFKKQERGGGP